MGNPYWGDQSMWGGPGAEDGKDRGRDKKKKKKKRRKRDSSGSSSSSSSSSGDDWRKKAAEVWQRSWQGWQQGQAGPGMMWPGAAPGGWPGAGGAGQWPPGPSGPPEGGPSPSQMQHMQADRPSAPSRAAASSGWARSPPREEEPLPPMEDVPIFLEPAIEEIVPVPKALLGKVIGKQAQTIIEIREKSGAFKVDARDQTSDPCQVKVAGTAEAVKKARELIMELVESTKTKHSGSDYVEIPRAKIGMVIGLKGSQVNDIQIQTGTKIDVDFEMDPCKCYIKGSPDAVDRAKKVLLTIAMQIEDDNSEYLDLPKTASGALIGAQGSRVREFQDASGARIDVDKTGNRCRVRLTGNKEQVAHAKHLIMVEVERSNAGAPKHPPLMDGPPVPQPMVIPSHQPTSFPATLSESIARAKAAAQAVKSGLVTHVPPPPPPGPPPPGGLGGMPLTEFGAMGSSGLQAWT